jgi:hypothetical protein
MKEPLPMAVKFPITSIIMEGLEQSSSENDLIIKTLINNSITKLSWNPEAEKELALHIDRILDYMNKETLDPEDAILIVLRACDCLFAALMDSSDLMEQIRPVVKTLLDLRTNNGKPKLTVIKGGKS